MFKSLSTPVIIGHRGACRYAPENTLASFKLAVEQGAPAIEFDVKLTKDNQVVVIHDPTVSRTTNGQGTVASLSLSELKQLDAGSWFSDKFKGERIPTLAEVFDEVGGRVLMNIELTNYTTPSDSLVDRVVELVKEKDLEDRIFFSSFLTTNLVNVRKRLPGCGVGYLKYIGSPGILQQIFQPPPKTIDSLIPHRSSVTQRMVDHQHRLGRRVLVYTVNDDEDMRNLFRIGVDGIITDDPLTGNQVAIEFRN